jgi:hypothetical protein
MGAPDPAMTGAPAEETMPGVDDLPLGGGSDAEGAMGDMGDMPAEDAEPDTFADLDGDGGEEIDTYCDTCPNRGYGAQHAAKLQARLDMIEAREAHRAASEAATKRARALGVYSANVAKRIATYAAQGPRSLAVYMETLEELSGDLPLSSWSGEQDEPVSPHIRRAAQRDPVIATYAARGAQVAQQAAELAAEFDAFAAAGRKPRGDRGEYVAGELRRKGVI